MFLNFLSNIFGPVTKLIDEVVTSDEERLKLRNELAQIEKEVKLKGIELDKEIYAGQTKIQLAELKQESKFVKMARPASTWLLLGIIALTYVASPFIKYIWGIDIPVIDNTAIIVLGAISGTHTLGRTLEKMKGMHR